MKKDLLVLVCFVVVGFLLIVFGTDYLIDNLERK